MTNIQSISALEILDSRGNPTVSVSLTLDAGSYVMKKSDGSRKTPAEMVVLWGEWPA